MDISSTFLPGVFLLTPHRFGDDRGWFSETWNRAVLDKAGITLDFVQANHSYSSEKGTLRGLHYQSPPHAQDKLVRCSRGAIFDVVVDVRKGSPTLGQWFGVELTAENGKQLLIASGFLHGFVTTLPETEVQYMVTDVYSPEHDGAVRWDSCGIHWPSETIAPILSVKDRAAPPLSDFDSPFVFEDSA